MGRGARDPEDAVEPCGPCLPCDASGRLQGGPCPFCDGSGEQLPFHRERLSIAMAMRGLEGSDAEAEVILWELFGPGWRGAHWLPDFMREAAASEVLSEVERSLAEEE